MVCVGMLIKRMACCYSPRSASFNKHHVHKTYYNEHLLRVQYSSTGHWSVENPFNQVMDVYYNSSVDVSDPVYISKMCTYIAPMTCYCQQIL